MYEYHVRRYLPAHIQLPHTFLKSHMPDMSRLKDYRNNHYFKKYTSSNNQDIPSEEEQDELYLDIPPAYEPHPSHSKHSMTPFIGSIQVRVRYSFQHPPSEEEENENDESTDTLSPFYFNPSTDNFSILTTSRKSRKGTSSIYSSTSSSTSTTTANSFHDAIEPKLIVVDDISHIMNSQTTSPTTPKPNVLVKTELAAVDEIFDQKIDKGKRYINLEQYQVNFTKMDGETKKKSSSHHLQQEDTSSDTASIKSHNFGDKNFAFRWINESFEEVAISHPSLDRMIGMVVSPQTRILLRAVVKMFNAFVSFFFLF